MSLLLHAPQGSARAAPAAVAVLGAGLIGSAIVRGLVRGGGYGVEPLPYDWADAAARRRQLEHLRERLAAALGVDVSHDHGGAAIVWSAGGCGFAATHADTVGELEAFRELLSAAEQLAWRRSESRVKLHLVSSAGGLFEGRVHVSRDTPPQPRRPYGSLKLAQERLLLESEAPLARTVHRPTSVYGFVLGGVRMGLGPTLMFNGLRGGVSSIYGALATLRDYVFAEDVGRFVARSVLAAPRDGPLVHTLAAGRPWSVREVLRLVEEVIGHRVYVGLVPGDSNSADITFAADVLPEDWSPTDLATGLRAVHAQWRANGCPVVLR